VSGSGITTSMRGAMFEQEIQLKTSLVEMILAQVQILKARLGMLGSGMDDGHRKGVQHMDEG
jgi:hypothetical protein